MVWLTITPARPDCLFFLVVFRFTIGLLFMNPYYDRILCVHRTHLVSNCILDFCFFIIHLSMDLKTLALSYRFQVVVFGLLCQDIPTLCYRVSLCSVGPLLRQAMVITCGLWGDLFHSSVFTPRYCPLRLSVRTCGAGVWMLRFLVHWRRLLSFVFLLTLARKLWLLSLSII